MKTFGVICFVKFIGVLFAYQQFDSDFNEKFNIEQELDSIHLAGCGLILLFFLYLISVFFYSAYCCDCTKGDCCEYDRCCGGTLFVPVFTFVEPLVSYQVFREASF
jgi:hypothetical protein